ncbi:MAG TPA: 50S ribosomal protein L24e [Thermoplasmata archaeon]|nr:50S ribosomal protein L24e [Thermoplasmata archaeon]
MVVKRQCSFCAREIEPGTGTMFVKRDGTVFHFCSSSCRKQQLLLGRVGHRFKWTRAHELKRAAERSSAERGSAPKPAPAPRPGRHRPAEKAPEAPPPPAPAEASAPAPEPAAPTPKPRVRKPRVTPAPAAPKS